MKSATRRSVSVVEYSRTGRCLAAYENHNHYHHDLGSILAWLLSGDPLELREVPVNVTEIKSPQAEVPGPRFRGCLRDDGQQKTWAGRMLLSAEDVGLLV